MIVLLSSAIIFKGLDKLVLNDYALLIIIVQNINKDIIIFLSLIDLLNKKYYWISVFSYDSLNTSLLNFMIIVIYKNL